MSENLEGTLTATNPENLTSESPTSLATPSSCDYPNCDCPVSFPVGYQVSIATECPKAALDRKREQQRERDRRKRERRREADREYNRKYAEKWYRGMMRTRVRTANQHSEPSAAQFAERDYAYGEWRDILAEMMGDPPRGRSALERRQ